MKIFFKINRNGVSKVYYIAIDIGGTQIKSAVIDKQLNMFDYQQIPTPDNKSELITDKVYEDCNRIYEAISFDPTCHRYFISRRC